MKNNSFSQLVSIVLLFLIIVGSVVFVLPMRDKIAELKVAKEAATTEVATLESTYADLQALSEQVATSESTRDALKAAVPSGYDQDSLLLELSSMGEDLGFKINAITFGDTVSEQYGNTISISANITGTYDDLVAFLQEVEAADRLMQVTSMSVQRTSSSAISFSLTLEAYYQ